MLDIAAFQKSSGSDLLYHILKLRKTKHSSYLNLNVSNIQLPISSWSQYITTFPPVDPPVSFQLPRQDAICDRQGWHGPFRHRRQPVLAKFSAVFCCFAWLSLRLRSPNFSCSFSLFSPPPTLLFFYFSICVSEREVLKDEQRAQLLTHSSVVILVDFSHTKQY